MVKNCINCGSKVEDEVSFCPGCGADLEKSVTPVASQTDQTQVYQPIQPKKPKTKLIIGLVALIVIVVVILAVVFIFFSGGGKDSRFVGTWSYEPMAGYNYMLKFNGDGSLEMGMSSSTMIKFGTWSVNGDQLCMGASISGSSGSQCYSYSFSNNGNQLTLTTGSTTIMTLTKS